MKKTLTLTLCTLFLLLFFWNKTPILQKHRHHFAFQELPTEITKETKTLVSADGQMLFIDKDSLSRYSLSLPYIEYDPNGIVVNYDDNKNITVYYHKKMLYNSDQMIGYPRLSYPYILYFSKDLTEVSVAHLQDPSKILFHFVSNDLITSWDSSPNTDYLAIGNLSGQVGLYKHSENQFKVYQTSSKVPFIVGIGVNNIGKYYAIGGDLRYIDSYKSNGTLISSNIVKSPYTTVQSRPLKTQHYIFFPTSPQGFIIFNQKNLEQEFDFPFKPKTHYLFMAKELSTLNNTLLLGYQLDSQNYYFETYSEKGLYLDSFYLNSSFIPILTQTDKDFFILYEKGAYKL